jgi:hypothetical protein
MTDKAQRRDSAWKEAIQEYFKECMDFFFPEISKEIDYQRGYEFLDKELEQLVSDSEIGRRYADMLIKVFLIMGRETWLLIHIEVQGYREENFALKRSSNMRRKRRCHT